jgi:hypothetical protein
MNLPIARVTFVPSATRVNCEEHMFVILHREFKSAIAELMLTNSLLRGKIDNLDHVPFDS